MRTRKERRRAPTPTATDRAAEASAAQAPPDAELVAGIAAGDRLALAMLYDRYAQPLYAFGVRRTGDRGSAEDLVQQVLLRVWRNAGQYQPERGSVRTWMLAIARHAVIDAHRRRVPRPIGFADATSTAVDDELESLLLAEVVRAGLERLSGEHQQVLDLVYFQGRSQAAAAAELGVPLGTVKSRTYYALRALRLALEELGATP